jgi:hypothetical protein
MGSGVDAEGNPNATPALNLTGRGTLVSVSATEQLVATQRGSRIDKAFLVELGMDLQEGDLVSVLGTSYEVISAEDRRLHRRLLLRKGAV